MALYENIEIKSEVLNDIIHFQYFGNVAQGYQ